MTDKSSSAMRRPVLVDRRALLRIAAGSGILAALPETVLADPAYPTRPVHVLLGFAAGGSSDVIGRLVCQHLSEHLGKPFVFDNHPGAGSNIATELVSKDPPDGYSLLWCTSANAINVTLYEHLNFDLLRDFTPVSGRSAFPMCSKYIRRCRCTACRNSSPTPKPIRENSISPPAASARRSICRPNCSNR